MTITAKPSPDSLAILLLTASTNRASGEGAQPLAPGEYSALAARLTEREMWPSDLLSGDVNVAELLAGITTIDAARVHELLQRRAALGPLLDRVRAAGLWLITRADAAYPERLTRVLGSKAPSLLYGAGPQTLLATNEGIGVVGSRNLDDEGASFARLVGKTAAGDGCVLVSGGAQGADETAMRAALAAGGATIGVLGQDLARELANNNWRDAIAAERCVLVSAVSPWAGFNASNLMARNKYVYGLSSVVFVAASDVKGGTWAGAVENQRHGWTPLYVRDGEGAGSKTPAGNRELIAAHGAAAFAAA
ncbi:MAG: DNA-protecting protein DprA, partial [Thermoleophilia bacterium]|nr:DNA-protecting protein DprA [Thermoleophilia bacterium]